MATQVSPAQPGGQLRPRYNTRSSIRHSLNLASMGRAIADAMHKDAKDTGSEKEKEKASKKTSSRRSSAILASQAPASRSSTENAPPVKKAKDTTPEVKTITRNTKRLSAIKATDAPSSGEQSDLTSGNASASPQTISARSRTTALRPRNSLANSALPKYRPKSAIANSVSAVKKPTSPARIARRRVSTSTEDLSDEDEPKDTQSKEKEKGTRAISPLPQRAALKVNLTAAINVRPATPPQKKTPSQSPSLSPRHGTSARPTKTVKTSATSSVPRANIPRPPSSASSSASPRTPVVSAAIPKKTPLSHSQKTTPSSTASHARTAMPSPPDSPLGARSTRKTPGHVKSASMSVLTEGRSPATPVIVTEGDSQDSIDVDDVEFLLGSIASPSAPTPAIPRIRTMGMSGRADKSMITPSRSTFLPSRSNLSYLSPAPPSADGSPFLRPRGRSPGNDRGSILSWEQLAQHNKSLGDEDMDHLLSEVPAPFRSGAVSPILDVPESPSLSALPSPTGYGSISQVLLPEVTPSPAVHNTALLFESAHSEFADAASSTLLRLQLAAAENKAQERLAQIEELENQLRMAKEARMRDAQELSTQVAELEQKVHETRRTDEQRLNVICSLEDEVRQMQTLREQAVQKAISRTQDASRISLESALRAQQDKWEVACVAKSTCAAWTTVRETAEAELELVRASRDTLTVLLSSLSQSQLEVSC